MLIWPLTLLTFESGKVPPICCENQCPSLMAVALRSTKHLKKCQNISLQSMTLIEFIGTCMSEQPQSMTNVSRGFWGRPIFTITFWYLEWLWLLYTDFPLCTQKTINSFLIRRASGLMVTSTHRLWALLFIIQFWWATILFPSPFARCWCGVSEKRRNVSPVLSARPKG